MLCGYILSEQVSRTRANLLLLLGACWVISIMELTPVKLAKTQINKIRFQGLRSLPHFVNKIRNEGRGWRKGPTSGMLHLFLLIVHFQTHAGATPGILLGLRSSAKALCPFTDPQLWASVECWLRRAWQR